MDRQLVFIGQIPLDTDMLSTNKDAYIGIAKLSAAVLGINQLLNAFTCIPTSPASMQVNVTPGEIYSLQNTDTTSYGSLGTDTHPIVKQGVVLNNTTLTLTAPGTGGNSWNYLVQIGFSETDGGSTVLPYYNASDPSQAWSGPGNNGQPNNTVRFDGVTIQAKQGTQAPTGTQTTPSPDSGFLGAFVVTVANGQTTITSGSISTYSTANFINETLTQKISQATADLRYSQITQVQNASLIYGVDTSVSANTITANLSPALTSYVAGQTVYINIANTNTGATTINLNSLGSKNVTFGNAGAIGAGDIVAGGIAILQYDGTRFQLKNPGTADFSATAIQNNSFTYAVDTGSANAYVCALTPAIASYTAGLGIMLKVANNNTTASTINVNGLGTKNITYVNTSAIVSGDLLAGGIAHLVYDGTQFQLLDPATIVTATSTYATKVGVQNESYFYASDSGSVNAYVVSLSPAATAYTAGLRISMNVANSNTGASTVNVNSLGNKNIKLSNGNNPSAGDMLSGQVSFLIYDGTNFQLLNPSSVIRSIKVQSITATGAFSYVPTAGCAYAIFELQAAGGGSGGTTGAVNQSSTSGPGGGGAYLKLFVSGAANLAAITGSVGAAGAAGASGNNAGGNGGNTTLVVNSGTTWTAGGGVGGGGQTASGSSQGCGSIGTGGINTTGTNGTLILNVPGQSGSYGFSNGTSITVFLGGQGGDSQLGKGGISETTQAVGFNYGGGGAGYWNGAGSNAPGWVGGQGIVIVTEFCTQ